MSRRGDLSREHRSPLLLWWWRLAPALLVAAPLVLAQHATAGHGGAAAAVLMLLAVGCAVGALAVFTTYVAGAPPAPAVVRRRASLLPAPLSVATPRVPHGPRAPGRR